MSAHRYPWEWKLADVPAPEEGAPTILSTFACAGGSSMGYKRAGFRVVGNVEIDPRTARVYRENLHPEREFVMDVRDFLRIPGSDLPAEFFDLDVLDGSPPCSTFSDAGLREAGWGVEKKFDEGQALQRLDDLFFVFLDIVEKLRPKVFVAENVVGLIKKNARGYVCEIAGRARALGYDLQLFKLDSSRMGVPQQRVRVFFIANRCGFQPLRLDFCEPPVTFGDVRSEAGGTAVEGKALKLLQEYRAGEKNLGNASMRLLGKAVQFTHAVADDGLPFPTLCASGDALRKCDFTRCTVEDYRNVASFPQDYDFLGASASRVKFYCGMSVPPSMMANVAHEIREQWLDNKESQK